MSELDVTEQVARREFHDADIIARVEGLESGVVLLGSDTIDSSVATKQPIYTVPAGKKCIATATVYRVNGNGWDEHSGFLHFGFAADLSGGGMWTVEPAGAPPTTDAANILTLESQGGEMPVSYGNAGDVFGAFFTVPAVLGTIDVDLFGYLVDA